jgi:hypothetical protein
MKPKIRWFGGSILIPAMASFALLVVAAHAADDKPLGRDVVARQGGVEVTLQDVDAAAAKIPEGDRAGFFDSPKRIESIVGGLLYERQLAAKAREQKLDKDPLVQRQIAQATDDVLGRVELESYRKNLKLPDFNMLAKEYYASHKDDFVEPRNVAVEPKPALPKSKRLHARTPISSRISSKNIRTIRANRRTTAASIRADRTKW